MGTGAMTTEEYWGYLIKEDKSPAPVFEQLLLGIANYIVGHSAIDLRRVHRKLTRLPGNRMDRSHPGTPTA